MRNNRIQWRLKTARHGSGFGTNNAEKQETRQLLISSYRQLFRQPPISIFAFPGMEAYDVLLFRETWPQTRIVCIDRQPSSARFTKAHFAERQTPIGTMENEVYQVSLRDYARRQTSSMWRHHRNQEGSQPRAERMFDVDFDFPKFNLLFIDLTANYNTIDGQAAIRLLNEHTAPHALAGVTMSIGSHKTKAIAIDDITGPFCDQLTRPHRLVDSKNYDTTAQMAFWIVEIN